MRRTVCTLTLAGAMATGLAAASSAAAQQILFSSDFAIDDTGYFDLAEDQSGPGTVALLWDSALGSPAPGSLRVELTGQGQVVALGSCFSVSQGASYRFRADVLSLSEGTDSPSCTIAFFAYASAQCLAQVGDLGEAQNTNDVWEAVELLLGPELLTPQVSHLRPVLVLGNGPDPLASCNYDNIEITIERPDEVPALDALSRVVLLTLVGGLGAYLLSQRRGR